MVDWSTTGLAVLEGVVAVLAGLSAVRLGRAYRLVEALSLRRLSVGFWLLAVSQVAACGLEVLGIKAGATIPRGTFDLFDLAFWVHYMAMLGGLASVFMSFGRHPFRWAPAVAPVLLIAGPALELLTIVVLFFVVLHAGLNHIARKGSGSLWVSIGFFFVFAAHCVDLVGYSPLNPRTVMGEVLNLVGFIVLLSALRLPRARVDA